jgi:hypothetical protein
MRVKVRIVGLRPKISDAGPPMRFPMITPPKYVFCIESNRKHLNKRFTNVRFQSSPELMEEKSIGHKLNSI